MDTSLLRQSTTSYLGLKRLCLLSIHLLLISSCNAQESEVKTVSFSHVRELSIPREPGQYYAPIGYKVRCALKDSCFILYVDDNKHYIYKHAFSDGRLLNRIPALMVKNRQGGDFEYLSHDSIWIMMGQSYSGFLDSLVVLVDNRGKPVFAPDFNTPHYNFRTSQNPDVPRKKMASVSIFADVLFHRGRLILPVESTYGAPGDSIFEASVPFSGGEIKFENGKQAGYFSPHPVRYPGQLGEYYPYNFDSPTIAVDDLGNPHYLFRNKPVIYKYNRLSNQVEAIHFPARLTPEFKPLRFEGLAQIPPTYERRDYTQGHFIKIQYDPFRKNWIILTRLPSRNIPASLRDHENVRASLIFLDSNYNLLGEAEYPDGLSGCEPVQEGLLFWDRGASASHADRYIFQIMKPVFRTEKVKSMDAIPRQTVLPDIASYLNQTVPEIRKKRFVMFVPLTSSCPACLPGLITSVDSALKYWPAKKASGYQGHWIFSAPSPAKWAAFAARYPEIPQAPWVSIDTMGIYLDYFPAGTVNGNLYEMKRGRILHKHDLSPSEIPFVWQLMMNAIREKPH